ncbi:AAA family ATPase [Pseudoalteromonas sp. NZS100]|uniref:AAA family ATPase n=1 Tax=Pseudoalteromonas sp. NZS100 TaxID=2792046 RepID=UPI0018CCDE85|nr:AAA family ATPase [Pseudoalteromonas sp. NZS100]MBH0067252.1 ATP-binding protein [Pseudoalteromonas sp. NZS100]
MEITLAPNPLYDQQQNLMINKVATLIGENGSGKSSILQSVFEERLNKRAHQNLNVVCFSSGQNENYSEKFSSYLGRERQAGRGLALECMYFDKPWSKLLIFLATSIKRSGKVRSFLRERGYVTESAQNGDDQSTCLKCAFKIDKNYVSRVQDALKREMKGEVNTLRSTPYFRSLDSFISILYSKDYEFEEPIRKHTIEIFADRLVDISFDFPRQTQAGEEGAEAGEVNAQAQNTAFDPEVSFFTQAADNNYFIDKQGYKLLFKGGIELDQLSDGEYQLLFLYALIDLFDAPDTLFLLDEADSHLHYKNVEKLWSLLHGIQGNAITTTHLLDSISAKENRIEHLKVVENGRINEDNKIKQLINRLGILSRMKSVEFEVCGKLPNIAILDDENDWAIFIKLSRQKGLDISTLLAISPLKKSSSYTNDEDTLGEAKVNWVKALSSSESQVFTRKIFLVCDRDEATPNWKSNGVQLAGRTYGKLVSSIKWGQEHSVDTFLLAWKRREIKHYLLSYTALSHHERINTINNDRLAAKFHLRQHDCADNDGIRKLPSEFVKAATHDLINELKGDEEAKGLCMDKLQAYIDLIPPEEISEDITNMYNFITGKL